VAIISAIQAVYNRITVWRRGAAAVGEGEKEVNRSLLVAVRA
jgi:hypothetical protein